MTILHEGWLYKVSSMEAIVSPRRVYAILSTRSLFLYREVRSTPSEGCMTPVRLSTSSSGCVDVWQEQDQEPIAYLRVEGVFCRQLSQQQNPKRFVVRLASDARDSTDGRMVKLSEGPDGMIHKATYPIPSYPIPSCPTP